MIAVHDHAQALQPQGQLKAGGRLHEVDLDGGGKSAQPGRAAQQVRHERASPGAQLHQAHARWAARRLPCSRRPDAHQLRVSRRPLNAQAHSLLCLPTTVCITCCNRMSNI